jgi:hypothetical protein
MTIRASGQTVAGEINSSCLVTWQGGAARLVSGVRTVLGRPHADPPPGFLPLTGASTRISKQQAWLIPGIGHVVLGRPDGANPVEVGGALVAAGQEVRVTALPAEVSLSRGDLVLLLSRG